MEIELEREFMKTDEVARRLGVTRKRVQQMVAGGEIPHIRRGRVTVVPIAAWDLWLAQQTQRAMSALREDRYAEPVAA